MTVACARCHDHKFDPIPTQDYYSLYGVFASSQEATPAISEKAVREPYEKYNAQMTTAEKGMRDLIAAQVKRLRDMNRDPEKAKLLTAEVKQALQSVREEEMPQGDMLAKVETGFEGESREQLKTLRQTMAELNKNKPATPELAMGMTDSPNSGHGRILSAAIRAI